MRGEAGIGKSRFLDEVLAQAELLGHTVRDGRLGDLDRYVPFAAFVLALSPVLADERDPELWATTEVLANGLAGGDLPLARLVDEVERLLRGWAGRNPVVLAVDDLHAADVDTMAVLSQLVRRLRYDPVTFVATMRAHAPDVGPDLAATVERLGRDGLAEVIDLDPLDADDVRGLIRTTIDATPDDRLVDVLWEATRGSPFYVVEGLRSLDASGGLVREEGRCRLATGRAGEAPAALDRAEHHSLPAVRARPRCPRWPVPPPACAASPWTTWGCWRRSPTWLRPTSRPPSTAWSPPISCVGPRTAATSSPTRSSATRSTTTSGRPSAAACTVPSPPSSWPTASGARPYP